MLVISSIGNTISKSLLSSSFSSLRSISSSSKSSYITITRTLFASFYSLAASDLTLLRDTLIKYRGSSITLSSSTSRTLAIALSSTI